MLNLTDYSDTSICRYTFVRSLKDEYCLYRSCNECEALWVITSHATSTPATLRWFLDVLNQNYPSLDTYWTTENEQQQAEASALYKNTNTPEQRRAAFSFKECIVLSVYKAVFAYTARLCKPVEFLEASNQAFYRAQSQRTPLCQVLNAHLFGSLSEVREITHEWMTSYNDERPHDALGNLPPSVFRQQQTHPKNNNPAVQPLI